MAGLRNDASRPEQIFFGGAEVGGGLFSERTIQMFGLAVSSS